jgi:hypothetical protein
MRRPRIVLWSGVVVAAIAAAALAGCGGSSSSSGSTTSTTPATTSNGGGGHARLSKTEWQTYLGKNKSFVTVTNQSVAKFRACGSTASRSTSADQYVKCMGDAPQKAIAVTQDLGKTLHGFHPSAGGACTTAINGYIGALTQWRNVVGAVQASLKSAAPQSSGAAADARHQYPQVQAAAKTFAKDCAPVG